MKKPVVHLILRRINTRTLRLTVPQEFVRRHKLGEGDHVTWSEQGDGSVVLKFVKLEDLERLA